MKSIFRMTITTAVLLAAATFTVGRVTAQQTDSMQIESVEVIAPKNKKSMKADKDAPMVINERFMPTSRRIDREINKNKYVFKGETMLGLTASYGTLSTEDADMFPIFDDIDVKGTLATINPYVGYFYHDNNCIGLRLGYTHIKGSLNSFGLNLDGLFDMDLSIPRLDLASDRYSVGLFHRSYISLDNRGRFGVFGEFEAMVTWGDNRFAYAAGEISRQTISDVVNLKLMFSPGVAVYAFPNVCATLSFGLGGFKYNYIRQYNEMGEQTGNRHFSKLNFRLNLADIRLGLNIHLWNKKKGENTKLILR